MSKLVDIKTVRRLHDGTSVMLSDNEVKVVNYIMMGFSKSEARVKAGYTDFSKLEKYIQSEVAKGLTYQEARLKGQKKNHAMSGVMFKKNPDMARYLEDLRDASSKKLRIDTEMMMKFSAAVLKVDIADAYVSQSDVYSKLMRIDPIVRIAIKQVKVKRNKEGLLTDLELEMYDKTKVIECLVKLKELGMAANQGSNGTKINLGGN